MFPLPCVFHVGDFSWTLCGLGGPLILGWFDWQLCARGTRWLWASSQVIWVGSFLRHSLSYVLLDVSHSPEKDASLSCLDCEAWLLALWEWGIGRGQEGLPLQSSYAHWRLLFTAPHYCPQLCLMLSRPKILCFTSAENKRLIFGQVREGKTPGPEKEGIWVSDCFTNRLSINSSQVLSWLHFQEYLVPAEPLGVLQCVKEMDSQLILLP